MSGPVIISLSINLILYGSIVMLILYVAFIFIPSTYGRARYFLAVLSFLAAAIFPVAMMFEDSEKGAQVPVMKLESSRFDIAYTNVENALTAIVQIINKNWFGPAPFRLWISVTLLLFIKEICGHFLLRHLRIHSEPASRELLTKLEWPSRIPLYVHQSAGPYTAGIFQPSVVVPASLIKNLTAPQAKALARHELCHAKWHDPAINAVLRLVCAFLWISIPLWFLERSIRFEREASADSESIRSFGGAQPEAAAISTYVRSLMFVAEWATYFQKKHFRFNPVEMGDCAQMEARIRRMFEKPPNSTVSRVVAMFVILILGAATLFLLPAASSQANNLNHQQSKFAEPQDFGRWKYLGN